MVPGSDEPSGYCAPTPLMVQAGNGLLCFENPFGFAPNLDYTGEPGILPRMGHPRAAFFPKKKNPARRLDAARGRNSFVLWARMRLSRRPVASGLGTGAGAVPRAAG